MATMMPKSRSSGSDETAITATPAMAVMADTMKARPVRAAATSTASFGSRPALPLLDEAQEDQRRELGARRDHERPADRGHRAQLQAEARTPPATRRPTAISTGHQRQQRADDAAEPHGEEEEHEQDRQVGEQDAVRLEVLEQADAHHGQARRGGRRRPPAGRRSSRISLTTTARSSRRAGAGAEDEVERAVPSALADASAGCRAGRRRRRPPPPRRWARRRSAPGIVHEEADGGDDARRR